MKSLISASSTPTTTPSPIDAALPVICALVWIAPPLSVSVNVDVAFAWPWPPASRDFTRINARWAASSFSVISTVPVNFIDIAPILHHDLGLHRVVARSSRPRCRPRRTGRRARGRGSRRSSRRRLAGREAWSSSTAIARLLLSRVLIYARRVVDPAGHAPARARQRHARGADAARAARPRRPGTTSLIHVTAWQATLELGDEPARRRSTPTPRSLRVREGTGGMQALDDDDKANIEQTIDDEVLKRQDIAFRSTARASRDGGAPARDGRADARRHDAADRVRSRRRRRRRARAAAPSSSRPTGA